MDLYLTFLAIGGLGLTVMAMSGFLHRGSTHSGHAGHAGHTGHAGHGAHGHAGHAAHASPASHASHASSAGRAGGLGRMTFASSLMTLMSPRTIFSVSLGLGTAGLVLRPVLGGPLLFLVSLAAGLALERILVTPIWNFAFRFESNPALTLESSTGGEATAVSGFDANGQGLISIELDGQVVQLLGTLASTDKEFRPRIRAGTRLRIDDVDPARNRCTVSLL